MKKGGIAVVTIPAFNFLWSNHDVLLHHFRRYNTISIKEKILKCNFDIIYISYFNTFLFPFIFIYRLVKNFLKIKNTKPKRTNIIRIPIFINKLLISILSLEARILKNIKFPIGVSIFTIIKK